MPYKLAFTSYVGTAFGGAEFAQNPAVAVVDRGGNTVTLATAYAEFSDINSDEISAVLTHCPFPSIQASTADMQALLQPAARTKAALVDGVATFTGLYLNRTGYPYQLTFYSGLVRLFQPLLQRVTYLTYCRLFSVCAGVHGARVGLLRRGDRPDREAGL